MRTKIDFGIDLGTTNSAIAKMVNGQPTIIKTDTLKDTLPSCVSFSKKQSTLVGDPAIATYKTDKLRVLKTFKEDNFNSYIEFKRTMGTNTTYYSSNMEKSLSSDELSSEVLKKLKSLVIDENISSIVITVPAKFLNPQNEATINAAKMAGFKQVQLLQEPVAAATAYGLNAKNKDTYWLVFDFGGGTFDAALVKSEEGILSIKDTDGDNWLGGKNLDEAIVDNLILPYLSRTYSISSILNNPAKKQMLRDAVKPLAEEAKIQLSFKSTYELLTDLDFFPFQDDNDEDIEIDLTITQEELLDVFTPIFQRSIDITLNLIKRNNLKQSDLGSVILVGGPTYSPILRKMLSEQVSEKLDTSVDPMTVVAKGASLYASTINVQEDIKESNRDATKLQFELKYESTSIEEEEILNIKLLPSKTEGYTSNFVFVDIVDSTKDWSSGKIKISEKPILIDIPLKVGRSNLFIINAYDDNGNKVECQPSEFSILQGISGLDNMQVLPYNIGIGKYFEEFEKDLFEPAMGLEKNKRLPATGVINGLRTRQDIRPGMKSDIIKIPIYQGDYSSKGTNPSLNNLVTEIIISGEDIPHVFPVNTLVDITIKVDSSQVMIFTADFPEHDYVQELVIDIKNTQVPSSVTLQTEINAAKKEAIKCNNQNILSNLESLNEQLTNDRESADGKLKIQDSLRKELLALEQLKKDAEWPILEKELKEDFLELQNLIKKIKDNDLQDKIDLPKIEVEINELKSYIEQAINSRSIKDAKDLILQISQLDFYIRNEVTGNGMDIQYFQNIAQSFNSINWVDEYKAKQLLQQGTQMIKNGQHDALRTILVQLINLMPKDAQPAQTLR